MSRASIGLERERPLELTHYKPNLPDGQWQDLWFDLVRSSWRSLVVVPTEPGISALFVAQALAEVGKIHGVNNIRLFNGEEITLAAVHTLVDAIKNLDPQRDAAVIAVDCFKLNRAAIAIARASEAALVVVPLGDGSLRVANQCIDTIGRRRVLGCVALS